MKRNLFKQICALLLCLAVLLSSIPVTVFAQLANMGDVSQSLTSPTPSKKIDRNKAVAVSTAVELEQALNSRQEFICITADFELDRTFYITGDSVIYSDEAHVLTRSATFGKDVFVVGENAEGRSALLDNLYARLTLGDPESDASDMLVLDGNKDNMAVDVTGAFIFVSYSSNVELCKGVTVINAHKSGNERTLDTRYQLSYAEDVGGSVAIIASGSMSIFGGTYKDNSVNLTGEGSSRGGAIYNFSNLNIYDATFENNKADRGGAIYNYRIARIDNGRFVENYAAENGGAVCLANSQYCELRVAFASNEDNEILFKTNTAGNNGGALYSSAQAVISVYGNTVFEDNRAVAGSGGAICSYGQVTSKDTIFDGNSAYTRGGAVYLSTSSEDLTSRISEFYNTKFYNNESMRGGALSLFSGDDMQDQGSCAVISECIFSRNIAEDQSTDGTGSSMNGGAIYVSRKSVLDIDNTSFSENEATEEGGALYITGESRVTIADSAFNGNAISAGASGNGGAIAIHSAYLTVSTTAFKNNTATKNGGALYISYSGDSAINAIVDIKDSEFNGNSVENYGGAIYATKHAVEDDVCGLTVRRTNFINNTVPAKGGAIYLTSGADAYMYDVCFENNATTGTDDKSNGGAIYTTESVLEINKATFKNNTAGYNGGVLGIYSESSVVLNDIVADGNSAGNNAGFIYNSGSDLKIYNSEIKNSTAAQHGGALSLHSSATTGIYNTEFDKNQATKNGGAIYVYTGASVTDINSCTFTDNVSGQYGGALLASNKSVLNLYNTTARNNKAVNGGVIYETTTDTTVTIIGLTLSGNTATDGGDVFYGNTTKAILNINKSSVVDLDVAGALGADYWSSAIANKIKQNEITSAAPTCLTYVEKEEETGAETEEKDMISVEPIFGLAQNSDNGAINTVYNALEPLDTSSNFMSLNTAVYDNVNGGTVTVDTFVYHEGEKANNGNFGEGILIYQAMLYKKAHPDENVSIDISSFRFSVEAAVCINRNSRYFGYMRNLYGQEYDKYGFVRISYLLVCAAKMGIDVTVIGQLDAYPISSSDPNFYEYFTDHLSDPCDSDYVTDKTVGDFMTFRNCYWKSYDDKDATDMMHTKLCAVSHYIDMNGKEHRNAVWTSSANLDGINSNATNGNNKLQTATIVSDHEGIYRVSRNYLHLIAQHCDQEGVYEFRTLINNMTTRQVDLILAGKENEINKDEQIVYLGSSTDSVFELYFTPFGGDTAVWDETYNPYCKYLRNLYNSEGYIILTWNNAKFGDFCLGSQIEEMIIASFHKNADPNNKIYVNLDDFNQDAFSDLTLGEDIGLKSFNDKDFGQIHTKDLQVSYVKDGQRYYVTLLNSLNVHGGSMSYQSNFLLVIKETELQEDGVFFTIADETTVGVVEHAFGEELTFLPESLSEEGYTYRVCENCDEMEITGTVHRESEWIVDSVATDTGYGIQHTECLACGSIMQTRAVGEGDEKTVNWAEYNGKKFSSGTRVEISLADNKTPHTFEATVSVPTYVDERAGIIIGNYGSLDETNVSFEIYTGGRVRLYFRENRKITEHIFSEDIRSKNPVHIVVSVEGVIAKLYINGTLSETAVLDSTLPETVNDLKLGGDNRIGNTRYFKGTIYSAALFEDVRTEDEIKRDAILVTDSEEGLLYSDYFKTEADMTNGTFTQHTDIRVSATESTSPKTVEALVYVPESFVGRAGVIVGNYDGALDSRLNLEIYTGGRVRLFFTVLGKKVDCLFNTDIRSDSPVHIAVTVDGKQASLYVDGALAETVRLSETMPTNVENLRVGRDNRSNNLYYFKGVIYSVSLFNDVRSASEIAKDALGTAANSDGLIYTKDFRGREEITVGTTFNGKIDDEKISVDKTPHTFEAVILVPRDMNDRAGVIVGSYDGTGSGINIELYTNGQIRLFFAVEGSKYNVLFTTDVRSDTAVHVAVVVSGRNAKLYVDGELKENRALSCELPETADVFVTGGDNRDGNAQYFKGILYSLSLFEDARTDGEILKDAVNVNVEDISLLYNKSYNLEIDKEAGKVFTQAICEEINSNKNRTPLTFEALVWVPEQIEGRAGIIVGNYDSSIESKVSFEIYSGGRVRLYFRTGTKVVDHVFEKDVRSNVPVHITVTVDGLVAKLYINGELTETATLDDVLPETVEGLKLGGDNRYGNTRYFKGVIYSVCLFDDVRTEYEIKKDLISVDAYAENLSYFGIFGGNCIASGDLKNHVRSNWIFDKIPTETENGLAHIQCIHCGKLFVSKELTKGEYISYTAQSGLTFTEEKARIETGELFPEAPKTIEITMQLSPDFSARAGTLLGNYDGGLGAQINVEMYTNGNPRLYYKVNNVAYTCLFETDVRSDGITHSAFTIEGLTVKLYLNGVLCETVELAAELPQVYRYCIGGDFRAGNAQYFKGTIYAVNLFGDVRVRQVCRVTFGVA